MTRSSFGRSIFAVSFASAVALLVAGCGQEGPVAAAPTPAQQEVGAVPPRTASLAQADVCVEGDSACTPTGAHAKHTPDCSVCHAVAGRLSFKRTGPAYGAGLPTPTFDATAKTCSNIACHRVAPGEFSYYFPGNEMDADGYPIPELKTVRYGGGAPQPTPSWYSTGLGCSACHGNPPYPPLPASDGSNAWHSGSHANNQNVGSTSPNACELCHNDPADVNSAIVQSASGQGTAILIPRLHANGVVNVNARFRSQCFGCH
jgi:hypothetical protein